MQKSSTLIKSSFFYEKDNQLWLSNDAILKNENERFLNFDIEWTKINNAKSYALVIVDYDASRVIGQPFIHWMVCNINENHLKIGANIDDFLIQGMNSRANSENNEGVLIECVPSGFKTKHSIESYDYFPPMPPDKRHLYTIKIFGLSIDYIDLKKGFDYGQLNNALIGNVIDVIEQNFWFGGN